MILANYIQDLLYRYDCVIIPDFGGFVTNTINAKLNEKNQTFSPPSKQISFNSNLNLNDGLLANYIASCENISFEKAATAISLSVIKWKNEIQTKPLNIGEIGVLRLNENQQYIFEPNQSVNYLAESFGLSSVTAEDIVRTKQIVKSLVPEKENKKGIPVFIKYAAAAAIFLTLTFAGYNGYQQDQQKKALATQEKNLEKKIQSATFIISDPLPTLNLNITKEAEKPYHVIAGAFQFPENAMKKIKQLKKKGFSATIIGVNKWGLTEVAYHSYADKNDAINSLYKIQDTVSKDAWLLVKK